MKPFDFATQANSDYIEQQYQRYLKDPQFVDASWQAFFAGFEFASVRGPRAGGPGESSALSSPPGTFSTAGAIAAPSADVGVLDLVHSYRELGHCEADIDPLGVARPPQPLLDLSEFNVQNLPMDTRVGNGSFLGPVDGTLGNLVAQLRKTYCGTLGVEFTHITEKAQRDWLQQQMEPNLNQPNFSTAEKKAILFELTAAGEFEGFLQARYGNKKRFGLEGADALIPLINAVVDNGAPMGAENFVFGMAHRGRLNVLAHVLNKPYENLLAEFEGTSKTTEYVGDGDVKYHLGYRCIRPYKDGSAQVHLSLQPNPSHLEFINPVIEGIVRAKQTYSSDTQRTRFVPVLLHGDAAFVGQGVVHETLGLSEMPGFRTGGTIHIIINNQVGFTTPPTQGRFTPYPTDVAKAIQAPTWHVNGDDPEACVYAAKLAIAFREKFKQDAIIDMWCYRKYGHNEMDEPTFTQPLMYAKIEKKIPPQEIYAARLIAEGVIVKADHDAMKAEIVKRLEAAYTAAKEIKPRVNTPTYGGRWAGLSRAAEYEATAWKANTAVSVDKLRKIVDTYATVPEGFSINPKVQSFFQKKRRDAVYGGKGIDYGAGEMLAFGSLLLEGYPVRMTGQDVERGTFSHRHAVFTDFKTDAKYCPLNHLGDGQAKLTIANSMLSECAVLGFEYGYASADPRTLTIWEAQFGDFVNGAQPIIDQFITAAESKWQQSNGLVMMLPHGYEGQGPEHSNAYMERFLTLCAEDNIQVVVPTTPAQVFHALRRQLHRKFRKPLVLFQPKALLKAEYAASRIEDFADGSFETVLDDSGVADRAKVTRLLLCTGKVYYSLAAARDKTRQNNVAIIRIEQPYPFPRQELVAVMGKYPSANEVGWVQEEPANRGAYGFVDRRVRDLLPRGISRLQYFGREEAASPATGSEYAHKAEEAEVLGEALSVPAKNPEVRTTAKSEPATANSSAVSD